jgi:hypothetical protein
MATADDVRRIARSLPRTTEGIVRDHHKFRIGRIVYAALSPDETQVGVGFPKEERDAMIAAEPEKFLPPAPADLRYRWIEVRLAAVGPDELAELLTDAWRMVVSKRAATQYDAAQAAARD